MRGSRPSWSAMPLMVMEVSGVTNWYASDICRALADRSAFSSPMDFIL